MLRVRVWTVLRMCSSKCREISLLQSFDGDSYVDILVSSVTGLTFLSSVPAGSWVRPHWLCVASFQRCPRSAEVPRTQSYGGRELCGAPACRTTRAGPAAQHAGTFLHFLDVVWSRLVSFWGSLVMMRMPMFEVGSVHRGQCEVGRPESFDGGRPFPARGQHLHFQSVQRRWPQIGHC